MAAEVDARLSRVWEDLRQVAGLFFESPSVRSRLEGTGVLARAASDDLGLLGPVARASGSDRDVRRDHPTGIYRASKIPIATAQTGDVFARAQVRWMEIENSVDFLRATIRSLPAGETRLAPDPPAPGRLGVSMVEGWRGEIAHVAITDERGRFARYKIKDPSFQNWTGLSLVLRGMQVSDFPLCNKSFNLSYAGHDL